MVNTIFGILGFLLLTAFPLGIAFLLFRRTPLGSGDAILSIRNYTILLAILGGPGILIALGLLFNRRNLIVIGLIIYGVPLAIMTLVSLIGPIFSFFSLVSFVDTRLLARGEDNYWTELEDRLGWTYDQKRKRLSGAYRGRMVTLDEFDSARSWLGWIALVVGYRHFGVGLADQLTRWIRVQITVRNPSNGYMHLTAKAKTSPLENLFFKESQIGIEIFDQEFAQEFTTDSNPKGFAVGVLASKDIRKRIRDLHDDRPIMLMIRKGKLTLQVEASEPAEQSILTLLEVACDTVDTAEKVSLLI